MHGMLACFVLLLEIPRIMITLQAVGRTPLHVAGSAANASVLIVAGADVKTVDVRASSSCMRVFA